MYNGKICKYGNMTQCTIVKDKVGEDKIVADDIIELPNVRHLKFNKLSSMTSFCTNHKGLSNSCKFFILS